ncbi:MAG TPA: DHA2 family efflux MFS transporter permease subunit [Acidimicrobiales bacterium]|jgi:EmrB/QacA subfamily drug resistance transporter
MAEPRRPAVIAGHRSAPWFVVATVCVGAFMGQLDASIVTLALPSLQHTFHASVGAVTWVGLSYLLVLVASVAGVGRLADMVGRKLLYCYGFAVFIAGSALCGLAPSLGALDGFRVLQGVGAAMLQANSVAIVYLAVPEHSVGRALGVQGAAQALGLAFGPAVGGLLLAAGGWRLIFLVNVPAGLAGMVAGWLLIPRSRHLGARSRFDWRGLSLFVPAVAALTAAVSFGDDRGWASPPILGGLVAGGILATGFVAWERRAAAPLLDRTLFGRRAFSVGVTGSFLANLVLFGVLFVAPFYLERGLGVGAARAGLELTVMPLCLGLVAPVAGRLSDRVGSRSLTVTGMLVVAGALGAAVALGPGHAVFVVALAVAGVGLGLFIPANNAAVMSCTPKAESGVASGVLNMARGMGTALGLVLTGLVYALAASPRGGLRSSLIFLAAVAGAAGAIALLSGSAGSAGGLTRS